MLEVSRSEPLSPSVSAYSDQTSLFNFNGNYGFSREYYQSRFHEASSGFETRSLLRLAELFGGTNIVSSGNIFSAGRCRNGDNAILNAVIETLIASRGKSLEILEVACGGTFGQYYHYGAPWLSRRIKAAFGDSVNINVSDRVQDPYTTLLKSHNLNFFYAAPSGCVYVQTEKITASQPWTMKPPVIQEKPNLTKSLSPFEFSDLGGMPAEFKETYRRLLLDFRRFNGDGGNLFICPVSDVITEQLLFGLNRQSGVNYLNLKESFPEKKFDLIIGRHLDGLSSESCKNFSRFKLIDTSVREVLSDGGKAVLHFFDDKRNLDVIHNID